MSPLYQDTKNVTTIFNLCNLF